MSDDLVARLKLRGKQDREMPNHYVRRMEIDRLEAAKRIEALEAKLRDMALDCLAAQGQAAENFQMYVDANEARIDAEARIEELEVELKTLRTEKHADAEAIGSLRDKLAEIEKVRGASGEE